MTKDRKAWQVLEAINEIEDRFVEEAAPKGAEQASSETKAAIAAEAGKGEEWVIPMKRYRKPFRENGMAIAAACALLLVVGGMYGKFQTDRRNTAPTAMVMAEGEEGAVGAALPEAVSEKIAEPEEGSAVMIANPFRDCESLAEAIELAGFDMTIPDQFGEYTAQSFTVMLLSEEADSAGNMLEVIYRNAEGQEGLRIRKQKAAAGDPADLDISGDYTSYTVDTEESFRDTTVRVRGEGEQGYLLTAKKDGFYYAISFGERTETEGAAREEWQEILAILWGEQK